MSIHWTGVIFHEKSFQEVAMKLCETMGLASKPKSPSEVFAAIHNEITNKNQTLSKKIEENGLKRLIRRLKGKIITFILFETIIFHCVQQIN